MEPTERRIFKELVEERRYFFDSWKKKTELEKKAIKSFQEGLKLILNNIPKEEIISVYSKGTFITRELDKKSDVDFVTVLRDEKFVGKLKEINDLNKNVILPMVQINPCYTLQELRTGNKREIFPPNQSPKTFVNQLKNFKLVYGELLNAKDFKEYDLQEEHFSQAKFILELFIPNIKKKLGGKEYDKSLGFRSLVKSVLWLGELELKMKGVEYEYSYNGIAEGFRDKDHVVPQAYMFRVNNPKEIGLRKKFIDEVERYCIKIVES